MNTGYMLAFSAGLFGGFGHCIWMCGPFTVSYVLHSTPRRTSIKSLYPQLLFNAGRITTYTFLGSIAGLTGSFLNLAGRIAGIQNAASVLAGVIMVFMGLGISGVIKGMGRREGRDGLIVKGLRSIAGEGKNMHYYPLGLLLGFIPCGLSYSVFIGAAGSGGMVEGALTAICFGAGTIPALLIFGLAAGAIGSRLRGAMYLASGLIVILMGLLFMARGISSYASL